MSERVYSVIRADVDHKVLKDAHELKVGDILRFGRAKLLVREINIVSKIQKIRKKNKKIERLREGFKRRQLKNERSASVPVESDKKPSLPESQKCSRPRQLTVKK
jgi:hypothetical protein